MIYGNSAQRGLTLDLLGRGQQVLCLTGGPHLGKRSFLRQTIPSLVSEADLLFADPGPDGARDALSFSRLEPLHGEWRILVVEDVGSMTLAAQDAYLKLLEEPPPSLSVVMTSEDGGHLHPALRSRVRRFIRWLPLSHEEMVEFASTIEPLDPSLFPLSRGRPGLYSRSHGKDKVKSFYDAVLRGSSSGGTVLDPVPEILDGLTDSRDRSLVSHVCRFAALDSKGDPWRVLPFLRFASILARSPSASAPLHWARASVSSHSLM
jgi:hypothetical protein